MATNSCFVAWTSRETAAAPIGKPPSCISVDPPFAFWHLHGHGDGSSSDHGNVEA